MNTYAFCRMVTLVRNRRAGAAMLVAVMLLATGTARATIINSNWASAVNGRWGESAKWSSGFVPDADNPAATDSHEVTIDATGSNYTVTLSAASPADIEPTIDSLTIDSANATLYINNRSLNVLGDILITNGNFQVHADPTITATNFTNDTGGTVIIHPTENPQTHVTMNVDNPIQNNGLFKVQSGFGWLGELTVTGAAKIENNPGATLHFDVSGGGATFNRLSSDIDNSGTVTVTRGVTLFKASGSYQNLTAASSWTMNQAMNITGSSSTFTQVDGLVDNNAGILFTSTSAGSKYELQDGTLNNSGGLTLIGTGSEFEQTGGTLNGGLVKVGAEGTIDLQAGSYSGTPTFYIEGVTSTSGSPASVLSINPAYSGGTFAANVTARGKADITGSFSTVAAGTIFQVGDTISPNLQTAVSVPSALTNHGTIQLTNVSFGWSSILTVPGVLTNASDGLIELLDPLLAGPGAVRQVLAELDNAGNFRVDTKVKIGRLGQAGDAHVNTGSFVVEEEGVLALTGASYTQTAGTTTVDGNLNFGTNTFTLNGGTLEGGGTLTGNVTATSGGSGLTISPGTSIDTLEITGAVTLDGNDSIDIEVESDTLFDVLDVTGVLDLGGATLSLSLTPSVDFDSLIALGSPVTIITATGGYDASTFGNIAFGDRVSFADSSSALLSLDGNDIQLSDFAGPVPEPSSFLLLGLSALGLVRHTRRRKRRA